jgi:hypothetical protein
LEAQHKQEQLAQQVRHNKDRSSIEAAHTEELRQMRDDKMEAQQNLLVLEKELAELYESKGVLDAKHDLEYTELLRANANLQDDGERLVSDLKTSTKNCDELEKQVRAMAEESAEMAEELCGLKDEARKAAAIKAKNLLQERRIEDMKTSMATLHEKMAQAVEAERLQQESAHAASRNSTQKILRLEAEKLTHAEELEALKVQYKESKRREKKLAACKCHCCCTRQKLASTVSKPSTTKSRQVCSHVCCSACRCKSDAFKC